MAVQGSVSEIGTLNGADEAFDYIPESHELAPQALVLPAPSAGERLQIQIEPGRALRAEFDIAGSEIEMDRGLITITLPNGAVIELQAAGGAAFDEDPPLLLQPDAVVQEALQRADLSVDGDAQAELTSAQDGTALEVPKPAPGETAEYVVQPGQDVYLGFSLDQVEILQTDADIVLLFEDGSQVTFSTLVGVALGENPPNFVEPQGRFISASELVEQAGDISSLAETLANIDPAAGGGDVAPVTNRGFGAPFGGEGPQGSGNQASGTTPSGGGGGGGGGGAGPAALASSTGGDPPDTPDTPDTPPDPPNSLPEFSIEPPNPPGPFGQPVQESDLGTAADTISGQAGLDGPLVTIDYGTDGPGAGAPDVLTVADFNLVLQGDPPVGLTSGGAAVTYGPFDPASGTLTAFADGDPAFTVSIAADGTYSFDLLSGLDQHPGSVDLEFTVLATPKPEVLATLVDGNGDPVDLEGVELSRDVTVSVADDVPVFFPAIPDPGEGPAVGDLPPILDLPNIGVVDALPPIPTFQTQSFSVDFGADGQAEAGPVTFTDGALADLFALGLTSGDQGLNIALSDDGTVITATTAISEETVFTIRLAEDGANYTYTFQLDRALDHAADDGETTLSLPVSVQATDADGSVASASFTVTVTDDMPDIVSFGPDLAAEGSAVVGESGPLTDSNTVTVDFGSDGAGTLVLSDNTAALDGLGLTAGGNPLTFTLSNDGLTLTGSANGSDVLSVVLSGSALDGFVYEVSLTGALDHGADAIELPLSFAATDGDGSQTTAAATVTIEDGVPTANDEPVLSVEEGAGTLGTANGDPNLLANDNLGLDGGGITSFAYTGADGQPATAAAGSTVDTQFGSLTVNADGTWSYTAVAAPNNTSVAEEQFTYTVTDSDGDTATASQSIQISDGAAPVATFGPGNSPVSFVFVDEADLPEGSNGSQATTVGDNINVTVGPDGLAGVTIDPISISFFNLRAPTSEGEPVAFTLSADGLTLTGATPSGDPVLTVAVNGSPEDGFRYDVTLMRPLDQAGGVGETSSLPMQVRFVATDGDGTVGTANAFFLVLDDLPKLVNNTVVEVAEGGGVATTGDLLAAASLGADDGIDLAVAGFSYTDRQGESQNGVLGQSVETQYGTLTVNADGTWSYTATETADQTDGAVSDDFTYFILDGDGDRATAVQQIDILDGGGPVLAAEGGGDFGGSVAESDLSDGPAVLTQQATVSFGGDGPAAESPVVFAPDVLTGLEGRGLTSAGQALSYEQSGQVITATAGEKTVFTLELGVVSRADDNGDATYDYTFTLLEPVDHDPETGEGSAVNDILFPLVVTDSDGSQTQSAVTINILDDAPVVTDGPSLTLQEGGYEVGGDLVADGAMGADGGALVSFSYRQVDGGQATAFAGETVQTAFGNLTVAADGNWTFEADPAAVALLTEPAEAGFSFTVEDGDGDSASAEQALTIDMPLDGTADISVSAEGSEDARIPLNITVAPQVDSVFLQVAEVTVGNIPADAKLFDAEGNEVAVSGGSATLSPDDLAGLAIQRGANIGDDITDLQVSARVVNTALGLSTQTQSTATVVVHAVADEPGLRVSASVISDGDAGSDDVVTGTAGADSLFGGGGNDRIAGGGADDLIYGDLFAGDTQIALTITPDLIDQDGSESLTVTVAGLPADATLSNDAGDTLPVFNGVAVMTPAQLAGLTLTVASSDPAFTIEVTTQSRDRDADSGVTETSGAVRRTVEIDPSSSAEPGDDILEGGAGSDTIFGNAGDDQLIGDAPRQLGDDLLTNGNFETGGEGTHRTGGDLPGWEILSKRAQVLDADRFKVEDEGHDQVIDSEQKGFLNIQQSVEGVQAGQVLNLSLDLTGRSGNRFDPDDGVRVFWNGEEVAALNGPRNWETFTFNITAGSGDATDTIRFEGFGDHNNRGVLLDNVALRPVLDTGAGDDELSGGAGDDVIAGGAGNDWINGGTDEGVTTTFETLKVTFLEEHAGYDNTIGFFVSDGNGHPTEGRILWSNVDEVDRGDAREIVLDGFTADQVGFFLIPDGADRNRGLEDDAAVTFAQNNKGQWVVELDGSALSGKGFPAYFSGPADLNPDGADHAEITSLADDANDIGGNDGPRDGSNDTGTIGDGSVRIGFEDLRNLGDADFNDAVIQVDQGTMISFEAGDHLYGGDQDASGDAQKDVFFHAKGDGIDTIHDFEVGIDQLVISGFGVDEATFFEHGDDTIIKLGDDDAIKLVGVSAETFAGGANQATHDADQDGNGSLSMDELVSLQEDVFDGQEKGNAPSEEEAAVVFVAPVEPGILDDGGNNNDGGAV